MGWHTAFGAAPSACSLGLINYSFMSRTLSHIGSPADNSSGEFQETGLLAVGRLPCSPCLRAAFILQNEDVAKWCVYVAGALILGIFVYLIRSSQRSERAGLIAALVLTVQTIFFFIFYAQMATSLNLFAQRNVNLSSMSSAFTLLTGFRSNTRT
jgi:POT family proton-dependent oligopeptide transporter